MVTDTGNSFEQPKNKADKEKNLFFEASRKVILASIGAMAIAQDELEDFVDKLMERGEIAEKDGRKLYHELREKRQKHSRKLEDEITQKVRDAFCRMNVPTKSDIDRLSDSIANLSKKVDELVKTRK